jgi:CBS-domain-containing membrane protein
MNIQAASARGSWLNVSAWTTPLLAGVGGFLAIWLIGTAHELYALPLLIPPFGASCVLAFGYPASPFARAKNIIGGHLLAASVGLLACFLFGYGTLGAAAGVGVAITAMMLTDTTHPPAGANPVLVAILHPDVTFLVTTVLIGAVAIVLTSMAYNKLLLATKLRKS